MWLEGFWFTGGAYDSSSKLGVVVDEVELPVPVALGLEVPVPAEALGLVVPVPMVALGLEGDDDVAED